MSQVEQSRNGKYDAGLRRRSLRSRREKGCWVYIPADELVKAGLDPADPAPLYRTWGTPRGGVMIRLYTPDDE